MITREALGLLIKRARQELDWTQEELAERYGCSDAHISRIEAGKVGFDVDVIQKMAGIFGKPTEYFLPQPKFVVLNETEQFIHSELRSLAERFDQLEATQSAINRSVNIYNQPSERDDTGEIPWHHNQIVDQLYLSPGTWKKNLFAVRVSEANLHPSIRDGDVVLIDRDLSPSNGNLVFCSCKDTFGAKMYYQTGTKAWIGDNEGKYDLVNCNIYGVVTKIVRDV